MRIALTTPGITPYVIGGMQRHSFNLVRHLSLLGVEIDLYHTDFGDAKGLDGLDGMTHSERRNITSIAIPWPKGGRLPGHYIRDLKGFSHAALGLLSKRPVVDVIYGQGITAWAIVEAKRKGRQLPPVIANLHGLEMFQPPVNLKLRAQAAMMRPAFAAHAQHADFVASLGGKLTTLIKERLQIDPTRIIETPGGIDPAWIADEPSPVSRPRRFLFLGRYERRKGIEELQHAICANPAWTESAAFRLIGPIPEDKQVRLPHVSYAGAISDEAQLQAELRQSDVLVCPSHSEGMPTVILEAIASGLAIIATDVGAVELLVDDQNGILLESPKMELIAGAIDQVIQMPDEALMQLKNVSLERSRDFSWDQVARQTLDVLKKLCSDDRRTRRSCAPSLPSGAFDDEK